MLYTIDLYTVVESSLKLVYVFCITFVHFLHSNTVEVHQEQFLVNNKVLECQRSFCVIHDDDDDDDGDDDIDDDGDEDDCHSMSLGLISLMDLILFTSYLQRFHWKKKSMANFSSGSVLSLEFLQKIMKKISTSKYLHWKNQIYTKVKFSKYLQKIIEIVPNQICSEKYLKDI